MAKKEETYNEAIEKLRKIVAEIENGDLDVDILSEKVKEATRLIKLCKEKLYKVDEEVKKVLEEYRFTGITLANNTGYANRNEVLPQIDKRENTTAITTYARQYFIAI